MELLRVVSALPMPQLWDDPIYAALFIYTALLHGHIHDFLVSRYQFVAHLDGLLEGDTGFL